VSASSLERPCAISARCFAGIPVSIFMRPV
jgi:hypothetical protein